MTEAVHLPEGLDMSRPSPARIYDYMLRGQHHFDADAQAAQQILRAVPEIRDCAWSNRGFHQRAASWIAKQGVRQFLDIGSGLPTVGNTHEVVKKIHPEARVVYVDNDPMIELYGQSIIETGGTVNVICGDLRDPGSILGNDSLRALIDPEEPAGLLMTAVMMFVADSSDPWGPLSPSGDCPAAWPNSGQTPVTPPTTSATSSTGVAARSAASRPTSGSGPR
jgi:S-adenosyl methyltransferase